MIVTSEAIVLQSRKQGETSKIVSLYTLEYGKLNVIAKGAREIKSKFGSSLEMFARISAVFYKKEKAEGLYLLSKADMVESNAKILRSLDRMEAGVAIVELTLRSMHDEEANPEIFTLLATTLKTLAETANESAAISLQLRFYLEFARIAGFEIDLGMDTHSSAHSPEAYAVLKHLQGSTIESANSLRLSERAVSELLHFFHTYFAEHIPGMTTRSMKSGKVFSSL